MTRAARPDGRKPLELREVTIECDVVPHAEGSCLFTQGKTRVLVTATIEKKVPAFLRDTGEGWITAEYGMLPRATRERSPRESARGKQSGRTLEIQRLVGRALRGVVDRRRIPDLTLTLDCDVLVADAGTRCASVTAGYVALALAFARLFSEKAIRVNPFREGVAAISVGVAGLAEARSVLLDLDYDEDSTADVDLNVVGTTSGKWVEIQGPAEREPFDDELLEEMLAVGAKGLKKLFAAQKAALEKKLPEDWNV
ncbi:MAG TPA: ribonuclease PH [Thermoanaerobaculia bacterium]|nr:ribonuclease PH [Thermoanaerobaculia bacterium]